MIPYAQAAVKDGKATATCPACGDVSHGAFPKDAARAYGEHYAAAHTRSYVVGLPVVLTVQDDGRVTATVDLSEAGDLRDVDPPGDAGTPEWYATLDADVARINAAQERGEIEVTR